MRRPSTTHLVHPTMKRMTVPRVTRMTHTAMTHNVPVIILLAQVIVGTPPRWWYRGTPPTPQCLDTHTHGRGHHGENTNSFHTHTGPTPSPHLDSPGLRVLVPPTLVTLLDGLGWVHHKPTPSGQYVGDYPQNFPWAFVLVQTLVPWFRGPLGPLDRHLFFHWPGGTSGHGGPGGPQSVESGGVSVVSTTVVSTSVVSTNVESGLVEWEWWPDSHPPMRNHAHTATVMSPRIHLVRLTLSSLASWRPVSNAMGPVVPGPPPWVGPSTHESPPWCPGPWGVPVPTHG